MKIGFDAKRFFHNQTGLGNYSRDLIRILYQNYPDNTYVLYNPKASKQYSIHQNNSKLVEVLPKGLWKKIKSIWRLIGVKNNIATDKLDIFHGLSGEIPLGLPSSQKKIVTIHDLIFVRYPNLYSFFDRKIHFYKFKYAASKSNLVIAISEQTKNDIVEFLKINPEKIRVVYQGCSNVFKQQFSDDFKNEVQGKFMLPDNFVLNVGTIETRKNALKIVKAIKDLDTTLVLVGRKTEYYKEIQDYINLHNLHNKVRHLSGVSQEELAAIYQMAQVFVYPSIFEGFGIPIIEALFSQTPVITTNSGVFPEAGGPDSLYVNPQDENDIKEKLMLLLSDSNLRTSMAQKGLVYAQKFTDANIAKAIIEVYNEV